MTAINKLASRLLAAGILGCLALPGTASADAMQDQLAAAAAEAGSPALAAGIITSETIEVRVSGVRRLGSPARVAIDDAFHIGSDAKAMLATLIAQEVEIGRLRWDSTLGDVLPDVAAGAREEYRNVTLADLLSHRAGLIPLYTLEDLQRVPPLSGNVRAQRAQFTAWVLRQPPAFPPGTAAAYSNAGYVVAAAMLERVTGRSYEELLQRRLLAPLGIRATFGWPAEIDRNAPWGHELNGTGLRPVDPRDPDSRIPQWANPAGNVSMSVRDFARFVRLHLRGLRGDCALLQPGTFERLHTPDGEYAFGWAVADLNGRVVSFHQGASGLFYALMIIDAANDVAAVVLANSDTEEMAMVATRLALQLMASKVQL
ncbi:MAG: serine hydrolase domain-containing protein [Steroidobacteraceae bacterium]